MIDLSSEKIAEARRNAKNIFAPIARSVNAYEREIEPFLESKPGFSFHDARIEARKIATVSECLPQTFPDEMLKKGELLQPYHEMVLWLGCLFSPESEEPHQCERKDYSNYLKRAVAELDLVLMQEKDYREVRRMAA